MAPDGVNWVPDTGLGGHGGNNNSDVYPTGESPPPLTQPTLNQPRVRGNGRNAVTAPSLQTGKLRHGAAVTRQVRTSSWGSQPHLSR